MLTGGLLVLLLGELPPLLGKVFRHETHLPGISCTGLICTCVMEKEMRDKLGLCGTWEECLCACMCACTWRNRGGLTHEDDKICVHEDRKEMRGKQDRDMERRQLGL